MANLGQNSSSNIQATVTIQEGGCITKEFARALQNLIVVEIPLEETNDGRIDILSANAIDQIIAQLSQDETFLAAVDTIVKNEVSSAEFITSLIESLSESAEFKDLVNQCIDTRVSQPSFLTELTNALLASSDFQTELQAAVAAVVKVANGGANGTLDSNLEADFNHSVGSANFNLSVIITSASGSFPTGIELREKTATTFYFNFKGSS